MRRPQYDEQAARKATDELASLGSSIYWLKAVVQQGTRVFDAAAQPVVNSNSTNYNSRSRMEEQFFLTACVKALRWIDPMDLGMPEAIQFSKLGEAIIKVRDEREHDDERYGLGHKYELVDVHEHAKRGHVLKRPRPGGKKPNPGQKFRMEQADTVGGVTLVTSLSGTVHSGGRMLLGGIVDMAKVVSAAEALIEPLLKEQHAYWDQKVAHGSKLDEDRAKVAESYYIEPRFQP